MGQLPKRRYTCSGHVGRQGPGVPVEGNDSSLDVRKRHELAFFLHRLNPRSIFRAKQLNALLQRKNPYALSSSRGRTIDAMSFSLSTPPSNVNAILSPLTGSSACTYSMVSSRGAFRARMPAITLFRQHYGRFPRLRSHSRYSSQSRLQPVAAAVTRACLCQRSERGAGTCTCCARKTFQVQDNCLSRPCQRS